MSTLRVAYRERQRLLAADLNDEQAYRIAQRRRHNAAQHGWGIVRGLKPDCAKDGSLTVTPGTAVDGYGREIVVPGELKVGELKVDGGVLAKARDKIGDVLGVWLLYGRESVLTEAKTAEAKTAEAEPPDEHDRWHERCRLRLTAAPGEDPLPEADFQPHTTPPDDPEAEWPIFLGCIDKDGELDLSGRRYATLVGEVVRDPAGRVEMSLAPTPAGRGHFAVRLGDAGGQMVERLAVDPCKGDGNDFQATLTGDVRVVGNVASGGLELTEAVAPPAAASPWRVYRTTVTENDVTRRQLRVELGHPGGERELSESRLVVGYHDDQSAGGSPFVACLTVAANGNVTVHGDLGIETGGEVIRSPVTANLEDDEFVETVTAGWADGVQSAIDKAAEELEAEKVADLEVDIVQLKPGGLKVDFGDLDKLRESRGRIQKLLNQSKDGWKLNEWLAFWAKLKILLQGISEAEERAFSFSVTLSFGGILQVSNRGNSRLTKVMVVVPQTTALADLEPGDEHAVSCRFLQPLEINVTPWAIPVISVTPEALLLEVVVNAYEPGGTLIEASDQLEIPLVPGPQG